MFRLRQKVGSHPGRVGSLICNDDGLGRSSQSIDAHDAVDLALGESDEQVAGTKDLIHWTDRLRAICQRANGLGSA